MSPQTNPETTPICFGRSPKRLLMYVFDTTEHDVLLACLLRFQSMDQS